MSDVMLCGILRMPPELWNDPLQLCQIQQASREAATELEKRADDIKKLRDALKPFQQNVNASSLMDAIGHIGRDHLLAARRTYTET